MEYHSPLFILNVSLYVTLGKPSNMPVRKVKSSRWGAKYQEIASDPSPQGFVLFEKAPMISLSSVLALT